MSHWYFEPILNSYAIAIGLAIMLAALLLIGPRFKTLSQRRRNILIVLRATLIGLLLLGLLRPSKISTDSKPQSATLLILFDQSRSLTVADAAGGKTRWQALRETLDDAAELFAALSESFEIQVYGFDAKPRPRKLLETGRIEGPAEPTGDQTDIGQAIHDAIDREAGKRIAGVIVLGDGAQRAHRPSVDLQQTARELARLSYPLYTVTYGRPRDQSQARDVAVQNLQDQYSVFVRNELLVRGTVAVQGYVNRPIPVTMLIESPNGKEFTADAVELTATENSQQVRFEMTFTPEEPGQHKLTIVAADQPGELVTDNNRLTAYVNALDGGMRVLFLHSNPLGAEISFLERSIGSSPDIQLDKRFVDMRLADQWPIDLKNELQTDYDVFLICDVDAAAIGNENATAIAQVVADGRGLMMTGGYHSFGAGGYGKSPIGKLLPIAISRFEQQDLGLDSAISTDLHWDKPMQMLPTGNEFITRLGSAQDNESIWRQLMPLQGANKFAQVDRRATVLARADDSASGEPLLVGWLYGDGRVLAFAGDTTYRWWTYGHQTEHKRFWRQSMLWLAQKDASQNQDVWIQLAKRRFLPGDQIRFSAGARGVDGEPLDQAQLTAEMVFPSEDRQPIPLTPEGDDWAGLWEEVLEAGEYQIDVSATFEGKDVGQTSGKFVVLKQDLELTDPAANPERMQLLASLTSAAGGKSVAPEQFNSLLEEIKESPPEMRVDVETKWQLGDTNFSAWVFFVLFVGLISIEWFLRKHWQLV
jgi:uncharacterized membrane protein